MKTPAWLAEFHRQWHSARGNRTSVAIRNYSRDWSELLQAAGIHTAEDEATARREAEALAGEGLLILKLYRARHLERITLPIEHEPWLRSQFGGTAANSLQAESLEIVRAFRDRGHSVYPTEWDQLCGSIEIAFQESRTLRPFRWSHPGELDRLFGVLFDLTSRIWPAFTPIRAASVTLGLDSKALERTRRTFEAALTLLFGNETTFKSLGFVPGEAMVQISGPLTLHYADKEPQICGSFSDIYAISAVEIARCTSITTTASRLLTIENHKTTLRQFAAANSDQTTLLVATSFPTPALRELLEKLPAGLPHHHFGDTDPAGWHILLKLRQATSRPVRPFQMTWRPSREPSTLTAYDRALLSKLLAEPALADVQAEISCILEREDRGDFEQESLGAPQLPHWPFFSP